MAIGSLTSRLIRALIPVLGLFAAAAATAPSGAAPVTALSVSDIHFNPFYDPDLVEQLAAVDPNDWNAIFATSSQKALGDYGEEETNQNLLASMLQDMRRRGQEASFLLFTGDILAHHFNKRYEEAKLNPNGREAFTVKTVAFVADRLRSVAGGAPVYFVLGNTDAYCGDYRIAPEGPFLRDTAELFYRTYLRGVVDEAVFTTSYTKGGYYHARVPSLPAARIVALNTVLFSERYDNACNAQVGYDPGDLELEWLEQTLATSAEDGERVWLLLHIPLGVDVYSTLNSKTDSQPVVTFWKSRYQQRLVRILRSYAGIIRAVFAGHTHMDNFRLVLGEKGDAAVYLRISPSISPRFGNNPGYQRLSYDRNDFSLNDLQVFYLDLASGRGDGKARWALEYGFNQAYGIDGVDPQSLQRGISRILLDPAVRTAWMRHYDVSRSIFLGNNAETWRAYWCAMDRLSAEELTACNREREPDTASSALGPPTP